MLQHIVISGEGGTDMGTCSNNEQTICSADELKVGPVAYLLFRLIHHYLPEWNADNLELNNPEQFRAS